MTRTQQLLLDLSLKPNYSEIDYVKSPCNWEAAQWVHRWPEWPMKMIAIYGEPGCGKTHLAHIWQGKTGARFLTPSDILNLSPHDALGEASAVILDNVEALFPKEANPDAAVEDWMFHFYNLVKEKNADL